MSSGESGMPPPLHGSVKSQRLPGLSGRWDQSVCWGGQQKWVYMQSGWEKLRRKNYYGKVEKEDGKEFKSTSEARQKDIIMETF